MPSLIVQKIKLSPSALAALAVERRSSLLLLGHLMNEANWLRKLLIQAVLGTEDGPEGQAQLSLVTMLASILASKLHEGWIRINSAELGPVLKTLQLPKEHVEFRRELKKVIEEGLLAKIRNTSGFHYPAGLDFTKLTGIDETDTVIYGTEGAYNGDLFSNVSALAAIDSLISHNDNTDWRKALTSVWNGVTDASGRYCIFISEMVAVALNAWLPNDYIIERLELTNAPALTERPLVFFAHLPDLKAMIAEYEDIQPNPDNSEKTG